MKHVVIGDTHGRSTWKDIVKLYQEEHIVFMGDYFDSFNISAIDQIVNFKEIIKFKEENLDRVTLLIGNHDFHYMRGVNEKYSGYNSLYCVDISIVLEEALSKDLLQMCYKYGNFIYTHAGVSEVWCENVGITVDENIDISINNLFKQNPLYFGFTSKYGDPYGDEPTQTPIWIRPRALEKCAISNYMNIVGHTERDKSITKYLNHFKKSIVVDVIHLREYLTIDGNNIEVNKLK
jgi:hypothetical protein